MARQLISAMRQYATFKGVKHYVVQGVDALSVLLKATPGAAARAISAIVAETEHGVQVWVSYLGKPFDPHTNYFLQPKPLPVKQRRREQVHHID